MSVSSRCENNSIDCSLPTGRPILTRSASTFSSASLSLSERSTDTLVLSKPSKKRLSISWSFRTGGWFCRDKSPCSDYWIWGLWLGLLGAAHKDENCLYAIVVLRVDGASRHLLSEGEKNASLFVTFFQKIFLASLPAASREPYICHSVSS